MHQAATVRVDREQVVQIMNCGWEQIRALIRSGDRDPKSGAIVHNSVLVEFENGARLVHRKGAEGRREFLIMPKTLHGDEAKEIEQLLSAGEPLKTRVPVHNGGTA